MKKARFDVNCTPKVEHPSNSLGGFFMSRYNAQFKRYVTKAEGASRIEKTA
jgi:transposase